MTRLRWTYRVMDDDELKVLGYGSCRFDWAPYAVKKVGCGWEGWSMWDSREAAATYCSVRNKEAA